MMKAKTVNESIDDILKPKNLDRIYLEKYGFVPSDTNLIDSKYVYIAGFGPVPYDFYYDIKNNKVWKRLADPDENAYVYQDNPYELLSTKLYNTFKPLFKKKILAGKKILDENSIGNILKGKSRVELIPIYKNQLNELRTDYKFIKSRSLSKYKDPIDFPPEVKIILRRMSREIMTLKNLVDPEGEAKKREKIYARNDAKDKRNASIIKNIKKETIKEYPDIKEAANIFKVYTYDSKTAKKLLDKSRFENISQVREYVLNARVFMKKIKSELKATGHLPF